MFYFQEINNKKVLKSDLLSGVKHCFTTRGVKLEDITSAPYVSPTQTHGCNIEIAHKNQEYPDTDGLILANKNLAVYLKFADCTPLIFYDPINKVGAVSHAGWRGTAQKIGIKTLNKMQSEFGSKPENINVLIGPAIGLCCYEVSDDVKSKLLETVKNSEGLIQSRNIDLKGINARQLIEHGVKNIDICPYCTSCNNDLFYSYRKENGTLNRHYAILELG